MRAPRLLIDWRAGEPFPAGGYTRPSDGLTRGADGVWRPCAPNVPRIEWLDLDGDGMRETPTVLLEPAATNLVLLSQDFSHWAWEKNDGGVVVTPDAGIAPDGTATADLVQDNVASGNTAWMLQTVTGATSAGATYTFSCWLRSASGEPDTVWLGFSDNGGGWQDSAVTVTSEWRRYSFTGAFHAASTVRRVGFGRAHAFSTAGALVWGAQLEAGPVATSYVPTAASAASRSADALRFPWTHAPQAMTGYLRFVERGAVAMTGVPRVLFHIGAGTAPRLFVEAFGANTTYRVAFIFAPTSSVVSPLPIAPSIGSRVELLWRLYADGSVQIEQSIDGGAPVVAARTAAIGLPTAWSGQVMRLSGVPSGGNEAPAAWRDAVVLRGADWTMDDVRRLVG